ncbi:MAG: ATP-binding cassette domain-containing protein [Nitrospirae bacterium]|nr:ATP-binding cassette domain-containing protein [Nitrospirota bacterium]MBF0542135.1 ATP-binding cassette domain-containing protein [Nitrospirota bacterium]
MIKVENLGKYFDNIKAVDGISFEVKKGEVVGFLGPNGAGKTTTMKMLTSFISPTFGTASICGHSIIDDSLSVRKNIGYLPETVAVYSDMRVSAFLDFAAQIRGFDKNERFKKIKSVVDVTNLNSVFNQEIETLSKGYKCRLGLAQAILHDPPVLILDEPTDGLDPNQKHEVRALIRKLSTDKAIIISTHILEEVESVCSRAIIISKGAIAADSTPEKLRSQSSFAGAVDVTFKAAKIGIFELLKGLTSVSQVNQLNNQRYLLLPKSGCNLLEEVISVSTNNGLTISDITVDKGRLDQVFYEITTNS